MSLRNAISSLHRTGLAALIAFGAAACTAPDGGEGTDAARAAAADAQGAVPKEEAVEAGGADAAPASSEVQSESPGKPTAPIAVDYAWLEPPAAGRDLRLELEIGSPRRLADVRVMLDGGAGLVVDAASAVTRVAALEPGEAHTFVPSVLAAEPGTHYLGVTVTAVIDGAEQSRSISIPVRLGAAATSESPGNEPSSDAASSSEERVQTLPAEEPTNRR